MFNLGRHFLGADGWMKGSSELSTASRPPIFASRLIHRGIPSSVVEQSRLWVLMCVHGLLHTPVTEDTLGSEVLSHHRGCVHTVCVLVCACIPVWVMSVCVGVIPGAQGHGSVCGILSNLSTLHAYTQTYMFITLLSC